MNINLLTPDLVTENWHLLKEPLKQALDHGVGESNITDWLKKALNWQAQIWIVTTDLNLIVGVGLTQFIQYSQHKTLHIVCYTGEWREFSEQFTVVEKFGKDNGCKAIEQWGRPGWSKVLPKIIPGFETVYHVMRKEIV
jgi:hypothetical protein